jgi:hypothetical protein
MFARQRFDFHRKDVLPGTDDDLASTAWKVEIALLVDVGASAHLFKSFCGLHWRRGGGTDFFLNHRLGTLLRMSGLKVPTNSSTAAR